jgi:hypothetical protein
VFLVGPPKVVAAVAEWPPWLSDVAAIESERLRCEYGEAGHRHDVREVVLVELPEFGRSAQLVRRKQRCRCTGCGHCRCVDYRETATTQCWLTTRAAMWATMQVGCHGPAVADVARDLGCGWPTVRDVAAAVG